MSHRRHREHPKIKHAVLVRVLSALIGLSFGFAAGLYFSHPLVEAVNALKTGGPATSGTAPLPPMGAPLADRVAATGRMDEDSLSGVLSAIQDEWVRTGGPAEMELRTRLQLRILFSRWTDLKGMGALKGALSLKDPRLGDLALEAVMTEWGLRDMLAASQNFPMIFGAESRRRAMTALVRAGVERSPAQGWAIASRMDQGGPLLLRRTAGAEWMRHDASHALRFLTTDTGMEGTLTAGWALGEWLLEDPAGFMVWRKKEAATANAVPLLRFPADAYSAARLTRLQAVLQREFGSLDAGVDWLARTGDAAARELIMVLRPPSAAAAAEVKAWENGAASRKDANTGAGWLARAVHAGNVRRLALRLADSDPAAALKWLAELPPEEEAALSAPSVALKWMEQSPASAPRLIFAGNLSSPVMKAAAAVAARGMAVVDPLKSLEGTADLRLDAAASQALKDSAFNQLATRDPAALLGWVKSHPGASVPAGATLAAVKAMAGTDLPRALQWVREDAPPAEKARLSGGIFGTWIRSDRDAALAFLRALPPGPEQDAVIAVLLEADLEISRNDELFAANLLPDCFEQALRISTDEERLNGLRKVLQCMKEMKVPADRLLSHRSLRPADRTALLKQP